MNQDNKKFKLYVFQNEIVIIYNKTNQNRTDIDGKPGIHICIEESKQSIITEHESINLDDIYVKSKTQPFILETDCILGFLEINNIKLLLVTTNSESIVQIPPDLSPLGVCDYNTFDIAMENCRTVYNQYRAISVITGVLLIPLAFNLLNYLTLRFAKQIQENYMIMLIGQPLWNSICEIEKTLCKGIFFFSYEADLTCDLQRQWKRFVEDNEIPFIQISPLQRDVPKYKVKLFNASKSLNETVQTKNSYVEEEFKYQSLISYADKQFVWNYKMIPNNLAEEWFCPIIQGSISNARLNIDSLLIEMILIGRRSSNRGGTRYIARGIDEDGYVANFCVSEFFLNIDNYDRDINGFPECNMVNKKSYNGWFSYKLIRGSVPCYWSQIGFGINPEPKINKSNQENVLAFLKHQANIQSYYGHIYYIDLLSNIKSGEHGLSEYLQKILCYIKNFAQHKAEVHKMRDIFSYSPYSYCYLKSNSDISKLSLSMDENTASFSNPLLYVNQDRNSIEKPTSNEFENGVTPSYELHSKFNYFKFDFHYNVNLKGFENGIRSFISRKDICTAAQCIGYFHSIGPILQDGIFRINCLDCLDRTNVIQWILSQQVLLHILRKHKLEELILLRGVKYIQKIQLNSECSLSESQFNIYVNQDWNPYGKKISYAPYPDSSTKSYFNHKHNEARTYFIGGWSNDILLSNFYRIQQSNLTINNVDLQTWSIYGQNDIQVDALAPKIAVYNFSELLDKNNGTFVLKDLLLTLWADMGDLISVAYTGTESVLTPLLKAGKTTLLTNLAHIKRSVNRIINHTFEDKGKQEAIDIILGLKVDKPSKKLLSKTILTLWIGTWNAGGLENYDSLNLREFFSIDTQKCDLYILAMQEVININQVKSALINNLVKSVESTISMICLTHLGSDYVLIASKRMIGILLLIFAKKELEMSINNIKLQTLKMGILKQFGNKGAVMCALTINNRSFAFVSLHLAPDKDGDKTTLRLEQFKRLFDIFNISKYDYWFLAGDFNCPAMASLHEAKNWLEDGSFDEYFKRDQLTWLRKLPEAECLHECYESTVQFWPTYKYKIGMNVYDKARCPSWCDRVLYGGTFIEHELGCITNIKYDRCKNILFSDHKPVFFITSIIE